jgi:hypothetical protein
MRLFILGANAIHEPRLSLTGERAGHSRRDEHFTLWLCRGLNRNLQDLWPMMKKFN